MPETKIIRILCMDDDQGLARLLQKSLQRREYIVDLAADGEVGLAMLDETIHDVLLVDYEMPVCGGLDVLRTLNTRPSYPPVIMVTGNGNEKVAVEAMRLGAADYIVKDVEMGYLELLPLVIDKVVQKQQLVRERELMILAVKESEERYRSLVELSPNGITIHVNGQFVFANEAGARLLGVATPEELTGRHVLDFVRPDYHQLIRERLKQMEKMPQRVPWIEEKLSRLDGSEVTVEIAGVPFSYMGKPALQVILRDITERKIAEERLEYMAHFDALTGLPNRTLFFDRLHQALALAKRYKHMMALLFIDLDRFKFVNDTLGHDAGDQLLKEVACRLSELLRNSDTVARMGGDEFTVILSKIAELSDTAIVAEKIIATLSRPFLLSGQEVTIGGSIGIALFPNDGNDTETLLKKSDIAMYRAKEQGRNNYQFYAGNFVCVQD